MMVFIVLIGIGLIVFAVAPVNLYLRNLKVAKTNKEKLDKILDEYNLTYTLDLSLHKKWPNDIEVEHKLNEQEVNILKNLAKGFTIKNALTEAGLASSNPSDQIRIIKTKLGLENGTSTIELVIHAINIGIINV